MHDPDNMTPAAVKARKDAWDEGYQAGQAWVVEQDTGYGDPYLRYLFFLGIAQAITNHARDLGGVNFGSVSADPQRKAGRA